MSGLQEILEGARDLATVRRVFGDPIERDGVTVIPAAAVRGGGGGGSGQEGGREGAGGGFGMTGRPVGVYVIRDGTVEWQPAVDVMRLATGGMLVGALAILTLRTALRRRR